MGGATGDVVAAALPIQEHWLPLSNLDLLLPPLDVNVCLFYKKPPHDVTKKESFISIAKTLKEALAEALVTFYAFAGEVVTSPAGEPELLCNNRGVDFVEGFADMALRELNFYDPDESIAMFVPKKRRGVISVQVTELKCGSIAVGLTFDHRVADAYSTNMFLVSWSQISRSEPISLVPSFRRSLLNPRRPLLVDSSIDRLFIPLTSLPPPQETCDQDHALTSRIYYIESDVLDDLQRMASSGSCTRRTKIESFSAFLWKLLAKHAGNDQSTIISKLGVVVDGRRRLAGQETGEKENVMETYFGNVLSVPFGGQRISDLIEKPLSWVADEVHEFLKEATTKDHFLNLIDWVETHRPVPAVAAVYCTGPNEGPAFVVSSGRGFPVTGVDFGWGPPVFGSYHFPWGGRTGYVMPTPSPTGNGDWIVYLHLKKGQLKFVEEEAPHVFKPINSDYLNINSAD
ncbi:PREDICTED: shikimate O-hydroxycinnamoyltransferase-like [Tarenaya hassleriana]|uniref:shikimate O-hydroxycinnamoyltransferase-like n=1 Tax=Tarenaya hassleriana TaxID=28532 RepID=UPI00053C1B3F|nr:PREDICTED: shikimate O-hydroxycinnamoyltransferase-like [Tarenaya hassleriana]